MAKEILPSELIKDTLVHDGYVFGGSADWAVFIGYLPVVERSISVYDVSGTAPDPKWLLDFPSIQIRVRGRENDYQLAGHKAVEVRNRLLGRASYDSYDGQGHRIVSITGIGEIAFIGRDDNNRPEFTFNLRMIVEPAPGVSPTNREALPG